MYQVKQMSINAKIIEKFSSVILENDTKLTISEMKKILGDVYKEVINNKSDNVSDEEGEKKRKRASKKNAEKPKKAPSAYNIFIKQKMLELKETDPSIPPKDLMKVASTYWSKLSDEEKKAIKDAH